MKLAALKLVAALSIIVSLAPNAAHADQFTSEADRQNYFTVTSIEMREVTVPAQDVATLLAKKATFDASTGGASGSIGQSIISVITDPSSVSGWVTLGEKIWDIIVKNKPVANVQSQRVSVLPMAQQDWQAMESWQGPVAKSYVIEAKNVYGMSCVKHVYTLAFNYGGKFQGQGAYLANATIIPTEVNVSWGYTLNSKVQVQQTVNTGSIASPVPGVELEIDWSIDTVLKHSEQRSSYFVRGDGQVLTVTP